jgi:hypothetical protein
MLTRNAVPVEKVTLCLAVVESCAQVPAADADTSFSDVSVARQQHQSLIRRGNP